MTGERRLVMLILRAVVAVLRIVVGGIRIAIRIVRVIVVIRIAVVRIVEEWPHLSVVVQVWNTSVAETTEVMQAPNAGAA